MKIKKFNYIQIYYLIALSFLISITFTGGVIFYSKGFLDFDKIREIYEGNSFTEGLKKTNVVTTIKNEANKNQVREAYKILIEFENNLNQEKITIKNSKKFKEFRESLKKTSTILNNLISLPELSSIYAVLKNKVNDLYLFIDNNGWKTLGRISQRIKTEISTSNLEKNEATSFKKTLYLQSILKNSFANMIDVTNSSSLPQEKKELIFSRLDVFKTELEMLDKYNKQMTELFQNLDDAEKKFLIWSDNSFIDISLRKIEFENKSKYLFFSLIGLLVFMIGFLGLGIYLNKFFNKKEQLVLEKSILDSVRDGLISNKPLRNYSKEFQKEIDNIREYVHQKISFGSIVFDSLPFATLFLDYNLSVIWANSIFFQVFGIDKEKKELMTWDYVQRFTNLGENDPIHLALKDDLAGIYQIQVKKGQKEEAVPYEIYVQPTIYQNQKRILLFLYPLKDLQESLVDQVKSIIGPVVRTIDAMIGNQFDENFKTAIKKDFEVGGIDGVLNKFNRFNDLIINQRGELLLQLEKTENNLADQFKLKNDIKAVLKVAHDNGVKTIMKISELKESFIYNIEMREKIEQNGFKIGEMARNTNLDLSDLISKIEKMNQFIKDGIRAFDKLYSIKENIKITHQEVLRFRHKGNGSNEILRQKEIDSFVENFTNTMINIETTISKIELILRGATEEKIDDYKENLIFSKNIFTRQQMEFKDLTTRITEVDEKMVKLFRVIYDNQKDSEEVLRNLDILISEGYRDTENQQIFLNSKEIN
jgi:hypothetical protein